MKVKDLIAELQKHSPEADIFWKMDMGCCGDYEMMDDPWDIYNYENKQVYIHFGGFDFLNSCRKYGAALTLHKKV